ncbi:unnamed protein product [Urochloa humidicola]
MDVDDAWASLPPDLLLDIFLRLEADAALRCTGVCKPWRRAIIGNAAASCIRPRVDCFVPGLLLGFFHNHQDKLTGRRDVMLQRLPGPSAARFPAASSLLLGDATDLAPHVELLSSRDGLVLLGGREGGLCLCSLMTGDRKFIPAGAFRACTYVLLTAYDLAASDASAAGDNMEALILAVKEKNVEGGMTYQTFSTSDGAWGDVTRSPGFHDGHVTRIYTGSEVICRGGMVHWLAVGADAGAVERAVGLDARTGRTWLTALPEGCGQLDCYGGLRDSPLRLAAAGDGRLSMVRSFGGGAVEVWVLAGGGGWSLRRRIKVRRCGGEVWFSAFCPRSGCLLGHVGSRDVLVDAERGSACLIGGVGSNHGGRTYPYEMDWSTYLAQMKHF